MRSRDARIYPARMIPTNIWLMPRVARCHMGRRTHSSPFDLSGDVAFESEEEEAEGWETGLLFFAGSVQCSKTSFALATL